MSSSGSSSRRCPVVNRRLLPVKATYFFLFAAVAVLLPYIPVYMRQLGLTPTETAVIIGVTMTAAGVPRIAVGAIVDKYNRFSLILTVCCAVAVVSHLGLYFIPVQPRDASCPTTRRLPVDVTCVERGLVVCGSRRRDDGMDYITAAVARHLFESNFSVDVDRTSNYETLSMSNLLFHENLNGSCSISCCSATNESSFSSSHSNNYSNCKNVSCSELIKVELCSSRRCSSSAFLNLTSSAFYDDDGKASNDTSCVLLSFVGNPMNFSAGSLNTSMEFCSPAEREMSNCSLNVRNISKECLFDSELKSSFQRTFYIFFILYFVGQVALCPVFSVVDGLVYVYLRDKGSDFGKERLWGTVSLGLFALLSGWVMDLVDSGETSDYIYAFIAFTVFFSVTAVTFFFYQKVPRTPSAAVADDNDGLTRKIGRLVRSFTVDVIFVMMFVVGMLFGVQETFFFWFLKELGADHIVFGVVLLVTCTMEIIVLRFTDRITRILGYRGCLYAVLALYTGRFLVNSFIVNPWIAVATESTSGIGHGLLFPAASLWTNSIAPDGLHGTIQGVMSALHFHGGKAVGAIIGGALYETVGPRLMFRVFAGFGFVCVVLLVIVLETVSRLGKRKRDPETRNGASKFSKEDVPFVSSPIVTGDINSTSSEFFDSGATQPQPSPTQQRKNDNGDKNSLPVVIEEDD